MRFVLLLLPLGLTLGYDDDVCNYIRKSIPDQYTASMEWNLQDVMNSTVSVFEGYDSRHQRSFIRENISMKINLSSIIFLFHIVNTFLYRAISENARLGDT